MGFMDRLAENPSSGIFGMPKQESDNDALSIVRKLKKINMQDYQDKARFDQDNSLRGEMRMRELFNPALINQKPNQNPAPPQTVLSTEQELQNVERLQKPQLEIARSELGQKSRFGQQALDIKDAQQKLNDTKNSQINEDRDLERSRKVDESTRKADEVTKKLELAERTLTDRTATSEARLQAYKDRSDAMDERHKLELTQKDSHFQTTSEQNAEKIRILEEQLAQRGLSESTTEVNEDGSKKVVTTKRGSAAEEIEVVDTKTGATGIIPKNKLDDKRPDGSPRWKKAGG